MKRYLSPSNVSVTPSFLTVQLQRRIHEWRRHYVATFMVWADRQQDEGMPPSPPHRSSPCADLHCQTTSASVAGVKPAGQEIAAPSKPPSHAWFRPHSQSFWLVILFPRSSRS